MTEEHVPVERLAAYAAGDLDATASVAVEAHVALCAGCRADVDAVRRATAALAGLGPVPMPADVAARVDAAVAGADRATGPAGDVLPMAPRRRSRPSFAGIAAVAAGVALVAAVGVPLVAGQRGGGEAGQTTAADSAGNVETRRLASGLNYTPRTLGTTITRALSGEAADARQDTAAVAGEAPSAPFASHERSGPSATGSAEGAPAPMAAVPPPAGLTALQTDAGRLAACVASLADGQPGGLGSTPLLVDFAQFNSQPALVVVFPTVARGEVTTDRADVWIVGPGCGVTPGDDDVLVFERIPRPAGL